MIELRHVGIVVDDIESELLLWTEGFAFQISSDLIEEGPEVSGLIGLDEVKLRSIKMKSDNSKCLVELIQFFHPKTLIESRPKCVNSQGITHIALTVKNLGETISRLERFAVTIVGRPTLSRNQATQGVYVRTNQGVLIELVEEL
jgi:catechol 2,3-dioxygenase-like lactoylglutathione lyase family enzyme